MKIVVKVKPKAREEKIELLSQEELNLGGLKPQLAVYKVSVKEPPIGGQANEAVIRALAKYFKVTSSRVSLLSGHASRQKIFEIF